MEFSPPPRRSASRASESRDAQAAVVREGGLRVVVAAVSTARIHRSLHESIPVAIVPFPIVIISNPIFVS
jgi:hypothetical protein